LRNCAYRFQLSFVWLRNADLAVQRVRARVRVGGHDVAEEIVRRRYDKGLRNLWNLYMPLADAWSVYDNSWPADPVLIGSGGTNRTVEIIQSKYWEEFSKTNS
jgi:predicted ABC-type ATPase